MAIHHGQNGERGCCFRAEHGDTQRVERELESAHLLHDGAQQGGGERGLGVLDPLDAAAQVEDPGNSSPDANFRFTDGSYHFNLKTAGLASGTWELTFTASGDAEPHVIRFQIR